MNEYLTRKLFEDFPEIYKKGETPQDYFFFGFECGNGWFDLLYDLSSKIKKILEKNEKNKINVTQVKEKFGRLKFYYTLSEVSPIIEIKIESIIDKAENLSYHTCEVCGQPGKNRNINGWYATSCLSHYIERIKEEINE